MGRWRNGVPLVLSPHTDTPEPAVPRDKLNEFDYVSPDERPALYDDSDGRRCPFGAHVRRLNPRGARGHGHAAQPAHRAPEHALRSRARRRRDRRRRRRPRARRLLPVRRPRGAVRVHAARVGQQRLRRRRPARHPRADHGHASPTAAGRSRRISTARASRPRCTGCPTLVTTRGSAYCLLPGIGGLRYLASLPDPKAVDG